MRREDVILHGHQRLSRRGMVGLAALTSGAALLGDAAHAQQPAQAVPARPPSNLQDQSLPYAPLQVTSSDGTSIAAQQWGNPDGQEIVFIHGVLQSHLSFEQQVHSGLAEAFRMVTYDLRGHGDSGKPVGREHYLDGGLWADDLAAVITCAGLRRPVLVGWSLGGLCIGNYLAKFGDAKLAGLNFVDALTKRSRDFAGLPENRTLLPQTASPDLGIRIDALRGFLRACFKIQPEADAFERMLAFNAQVPQHVMASILGGISLDPEEAYRRVKVPVLVTHGAEDGLISIKITEYDRSVMPRSTLSIYEGSGHSPFYEMAPRFNAELAAFVRAANA